MKKNNESVLRSLWGVLLVITGKMKDLFPDVIHETWQAVCKAFRAAGLILAILALLLAALVLSVVALPLGVLCWVLIVMSIQAQKMIDDHHRNKQAELKVIENHPDEKQAIIEANTPKLAQPE